MELDNIFLTKPDALPKIYAYKLENVPSHEGYIKVGFTDRPAKTKIDE